MCYSPFEDESDSTKYEIQVAEFPEQETAGQWCPPSPAFYTSNWRSPSQNKLPHRSQLISKLWLANGRHLELPDHHMTLGNLTGRNYNEAFRDLHCLQRPRESSPRTPSLTSDDSYSRHSLTISTPRNSIKDLSPSPKLVSEVTLASFQSDNYPEADSALSCQSMEIGLTTSSDNISVSVIQSSASPNVFRKDVAKCVESPVEYSASEFAVPPPRLHLSFPNPKLAFSPGAVRKLATGSSFQKPLSYTGEEDDCDTYLPESSSGSRIGTRTKTSSLKFGCPRCPQRFTRNFDMERHVKNIHVTQTKETIIALTCTCCGECLSRKDSFKRHIERIPHSCTLVAKKKRKPAPARLSEEMYAIRKIEMLEPFTRRSSHA